jgi:hypothetical protein
MRKLRGFRIGRLSRVKRGNRVGSRDLFCW